MENLIAPEQYNLISEIEKYAENPDKLALIYDSEDGDSSSITYRNLMKKANQIANGLLGNGLAQGDRILIMMPRHIDTYAVYIGALKAGLVIIPCSEMLRAKDINYRLHHAEAKGAFLHHSLIDRMDEQDSGELALLATTKRVKDERWLSLEDWYQHQPEHYEIAATGKDDIAFIPYTSGTTGNPKGVVHTHGWAYAHLRTASASWMGIEENDTVWATAGPGWQKWLWSPFISTLGSGATGFLYKGAFDPEVYLDLLEKHKVNVLCCTPTEYRIMAKVDNLETYRLSHLKSAVSAGEPLNREVINTFLRIFNVEVRDGYGQTENTLLVGTTKDMVSRPGSMGKPTPGNKVEVIDLNGQPVAAGEVGDIAVHRSTPALFKSYFKDPERTQRAFRGDYYVTGDRAKKDEDGYLWFEGRADDIIISSGYTIGPFEVEDALVKHPKVKECAVIASPDEIRGNIVKAYVVLKNSAESQNADLIKELQDFVKKNTAPYKYPRKIEFVDDLPKTTSGKIRRIELRQRETQI